MKNVILKKKSKSISRTKKYLYNMQKDLFINNINDIIEYLILLIDKTSFWIACLGCIYNIWLYVATHNKKYSSRVTVLILTYIFVQMIVCEAR